jgi:hypothetical protein
MVNPVVTTNWRIPKSETLSPKQYQMTNFKRHTKAKIQTGKGQFRHLGIWTPIVTWVLEFGFA